MSEYWKSTPKYWCKHCSTYVKDTPFEKKQHESTGKHQGNLKRFLRGIQNDHEKGEREKEKAKAEVARLNRVVGAQSSSGESSAASQPSAVRKSTFAAPTAVDQKRQWAQLAEMGIQVPDAFRAEMAMPGQWQTVSKQSDEISAAEGSLNKGVRKRKLEGEEEDEQETHDVGKRRGWGTSTRRYPQQEDLDLDDLLSTPVVKKESVIKSQPQSELPNFIPKAETQTHPTTATMSKQPEAETHDESDHGNTTLAVDRADVKEEDVGSEGPALLTNLAENSPVPVFKKRKVKSKSVKDAD